MKALVLGSYGGRADWFRHRRGATHWAGCTWRQSLANMSTLDLDSSIAPVTAAPHQPSVGHPIANAEPPSHCLILIAVWPDRELNRIQVLTGDKVQVEMTPYDLTKGRIADRFE